MREYELILVVQPDLDENAFNEVINKVKGWIIEGDGQVSKMDLWGKRKLAYKIRKQKEGQYVLLNVTMPPALTITLERNLRLLEPVMRFLLAVK